MIQSLVYSSECPEETWPGSCCSQQPGWVSESSWHCHLEWSSQTCWGQWSCAGSFAYHWQRRCQEPRSWAGMPSWERVHWDHWCWNWNNFILFRGNCPHTPESLVHPGLSEVAVKRVDLVHLVHWTHGSDVQVHMDSDCFSSSLRSHSPVVAWLKQEIVQCGRGLLPKRGSRPA